MQIKVDASEVLGMLNSLHKQAPFAISRALNNLAVSGQHEVQARLGTAFTLRRRVFVERTVKMLQFANKRALVAVVGIDPERDFLAKFEEGGQKRSLTGRSLAVPIAARRGKTGIVVKSMRVRELQLRAQHTKSGAVQLKGLHRTFAVKGPTGGAILQRVGRKAKGRTLSEEIAAGSVRVAYAFKRSVPIPASLQFYATFQRAAEKWPQFMEAAWAQALATAR